MSAGPGVDPLRTARSERAIAIGVIVIVLAVLVQACVVVQARPQSLLSGASGMIDLVSRSWPPAFGMLPGLVWPIIETVDLAIFGTVFGTLLAFPLAFLAAANTTPSRPVYYLARTVISITRIVPSIVWALIFVTAVGLGPFPGALALTVHSVGMMGRLFAEAIEDTDMGPVDALTLTGASRLQILSHAIVPDVLPRMLSISLYRFDENLRSSLILGFVGAGGIGFQLMSAMSLFQYDVVAFLLIITYVLVISAERFSAWLRDWVRQ